MELEKNKSNRRQRTLHFVFEPSIKQGVVLDSITYASSKLWNVANFERKAWTEAIGKKYPNWYDQKKRLKTNFWYKALAAQTSQEVLKQLDGAWKSFYKLKKTKGIEKPKPPRFKRENFNVRWLNKGFKLEANFIKLAISKQQKIYLKETKNVAINFLYIKLPKNYQKLEGKPKIIEIIPDKKTKKYQVNIILELPPVEAKKANGRYLSIDFGINNLMACYSNTGKTFIISGRQLLSINRYFAKTISHYQAIFDAQQAAKGLKYYKQSKKMEQLYAKRAKQVAHLLHAATKKVLEFAEKEKVTKIILGDISGIREEKNLGHVNNQKFHAWPFDKIEALLRYKAEDKGIAFAKQEESFTSQCPPLAKEISVKTAEKKNRKARGLYLDNGKLLNADCVGAYNIQKKYLQRAGQPAPAVVGLDTPSMYRWNSSKGFLENTKLVNS